MRDEHIIFIGAMDSPEKVGYGIISDVTGDTATMTVHVGPEHPFKKGEMVATKYGGRTEYERQAKQYKLWKVKEVDGSNVILEFDSVVEDKDEEDKDDGPSPSSPPPIHVDEEMEDDSDGDTPPRLGPTPAATPTDQDRRAMPPPPPRPRTVSID